MNYKLFGWWYRWQACKLSATVFFERYMMDGASGTLEEFGPNDPVELKEVSTNATPLP